MAFVRREDLAAGEEEDLKDNDEVSLRWSRARRDRRRGTYREFDRISETRCLYLSSCRKEVFSETHFRADPR